MSGLTYLITGANRGIGRGLLESYALRPNSTVIAAVRDVSSSTKTLSSVPVGEGSKIIIVKIDSVSPTDPTEAAASLQKDHNIKHIDILISNAAIMPAKAILPAISTPPSYIREIFEVNTLGPLLLIQAFHPLLSLSPNPKFLVLTSTVGSIGSLGTYKVPFFAYGLSKAAANYLVAKLHWENEAWTVVAFNPGFVSTDMGKGAAKAVGLEDAPVSIEESVRGLTEQFDRVSRGEDGGKFLTQDGEGIEW